MKVQIQAPGFKLTKLQRSNVERAVLFALTRFGDRVGHVVVQFSKSSTDDGRLDKRCEIDVVIRSRSVRAEHTDRDLQVAVDFAIRRASRSVERTLERESEWQES